jgi:predicted TIM-barrel fold metal-dependent hydrolase
MNLDEVAAEPAPIEEIIDPSLAIIDAHHHVWPQGSFVPYDEPALLSDLGRGHNIVASVYVECSAAYYGSGDELLRPVGETEYVVRTFPLDPGSKPPRVAAAILGWVDLTRGHDTGLALDTQVAAGQGRFRGVRDTVAWHRDHPRAAGREVTPNILAEPRYRAGLRELARRDLTFDVWLFHGQLSELADTIDALPDLTVVVDHLGGPAPKRSTPESRKAIFDEWRRELTALAERPNVLLKIGGAGMPLYGFGLELGPRASSSILAAAWKPYFEAAIDAFGPERCMFESNFPIDKQSASYDAVWNAFKLLSAGLSQSERDFLFADTAKRVYSLTV